MDRPAFEKLVHNSLRRLPRRFKQKLQNISVVVEDNPSASLLKDMDIESGTLFGLYQGVPLTERGWNYGNVLPDRIVIYQQPIEAAASSPEEIEEIVRDTVMHEVGHYFGFDDSELYEMEEEKRRGKRKRK
jgi:predicted Zn-dependent protease with MMP-like domain